MNGGDLADLDIRIGSNMAALMSIDDKVNTNASTIDDFEGKAKSNTDAIVMNSEGIDALSTRITGLDTTAM